MGKERLRREAQVDQINYAACVGAEQLPYMEIGSVPAEYQTTFCAPMQQQQELHIRLLVYKHVAPILDQKHLKEGSDWLAICYP